MTERILVVEDNPVQARLIEMYLRDDYEVVVAPDGEEGLKAARSSSFALVILDIGLPGISGYDVCKEIKDDFDISDLPVIFMSANNEEEDRLRGFEVGAFDYLSKPVARAELLAKVSALLKFQEDKRELKQSVSYASSTAMTAMSSASEQGLVLQFFTKSFDCHTSDELARTVINACRDFGLEALVQLRGVGGICNRSSVGNCSPVEVSILGNLSMGGRITDLGKRTAICYEQITLILLNMPKDEAERYGRLRDHLATLCEGANARMHALDRDAELKIMAEQRLDMVNIIGAQLLKINRTAMELHNFSLDTISNVAERLHESIPLLDLNLNQEKMLVTLMHMAEQNLEESKMQSVEVEKAMVEAMETLQNINRDAQAAMAEHKNN